MGEHHGKVHWSELMTGDVPKALDYYKSICGWEVNEMTMPDGGTYYVATRDGVPTAGIMALADMPGADAVPPHWLTYLAVDDVDAAEAETTARGGTILRAAWDVPGVGRISILTDPGGAALGLITPSDD